MSHKPTVKYARHPDDWYVEPKTSTAFLLKRETFRGITLDPCCGGGNIPISFIEHGLQAIGTDIRQRVPDAPWFAGIHDLLKGDVRDLPHCNNIVMNPPFFKGVGSEAAIIKALSAPVEKVAAFVPMRFLFGEKRAPRFWIGNEPSRIYPVYPRPSCPPGDFLERGGKAEGGTDDYVWAVWDRGPSRGFSRFVWRV